MVLREQLAGMEENESLIAEYRSAAIEEKERADNALLRAVASHEELANLRASITEARKAAESEKEKATSALKQLEIVQGQLAALISLESDRTKTKGQLEQEQDQVVAAPLINHRNDLLPPTPILQLPLPLARYTPPSDMQRKDAERDTRPAKGKGVTSGKARQVSLPPKVSLPPGAKALARPDRDAATASIRSRRQLMDSEAAGVTDLGRIARGQSVQAGEKTLPRASQRPRLIAQDIHDWHNPGVLSLPSALLPDSRLW
jgi:hypothetical protein